MLLKRTSGSLDQVFQALAVKNVESLVASLGNFHLQQLANGAGNRIRCCPRPDGDLHVLGHLVNKPVTAGLWIGFRHIEDLGIDTLDIGHGTEANNA